MGQRLNTNENASEWKYWSTLNAHVFLCALHHRFYFNWLYSLWNLCLVPSCFSPNLQCLYTVTYIHIRIFESAKCIIKSWLSNYGCTFCTFDINHCIVNRIEYQMQPITIKQATWRIMSSFRSLFYGFFFYYRFKIRNSY